MLNCCPCSVINRKFCAQFGALQTTSIMIMNTSVYVLVLTVCSLVAAKDISKRNFVQFGNVIHEYTGQSGLAYNNYGCYCGLGGSGTPIDDIDRCCQAHDHCYDNIRDKGGCNPVFWSHYHYEKLSTGGVACVQQGNDGYCDVQTCECDKAAGACFARYHLNPAHKHYDTSKC